MRCTNKQYVDNFRLKCKNAAPKILSLPDHKQLYITCIIIVKYK